jgi:hypothetical protein
LIPLITDDRRNNKNNQKIAYGLAGTRLRMEQWHTSRLLSGTGMERHRKGINFRRIQWDTLRPGWFMRYIYNADDELEILASGS